MARRTATIAGLHESCEVLGGEAASPIPKVWPGTLHRTAWNHSGFDTILLLTLERLQAAPCFTGTIHMSLLTAAVVIAIAMATASNVQHPTMPPGMSHEEHLKQRQEETPPGARVLIESNDREAQSAVHAFLPYQIVEHKTDDPLDVKTPERSHR